jgi:hypothetical protein
MNHQKLLLQIIEEEIESFLLEQVAPPAAPVPPAAPEAPATPDAPAEDTEEGSEESDTAKKIKSLASKTAIDIKKILLSDLQDGGKREEAEAIVAYVNKKEEEPTEASDEEQVPPNVKKAVDHIQKTFKFKVPEKAKEKVEKEKEEPASAAQPPASPAAPVTESRLQTTLREYLHYKRLYNKNKKSGSI